MHRAKLVQFECVPELSRTFDETHRKWNEQGKHLCRDYAVNICIFFMKIKYSNTIFYRQLIVSCYVLTQPKTNRICKYVKRKCDSFSLVRLGTVCQKSHPSSRLVEVGYRFTLGNVKAASSNKFTATARQRKGNTITT